MALTLSALFTPLSTFFVDKFGTPSGGSVVFRLDKVGSVLSEKDFTDPAHPELGALPGLALEKFSDLVNRVPVDGGDGYNVLLSQRSIDDSYFFHLLSPAQPRPPDGEIGQAAEAVANTFNAEKAEALRRYAAIKLTSLTGLLMTYKPSLAAPQNWYDPSSDGWTSFSFDVSAPGQSHPHPKDPGLWTLRPDAELLKRVAPEVLKPQVFPRPHPHPDDDEALVELRRRIHDGRFNEITTAGERVTSTRTVDRATTRVDRGARVHPETVGSVFNPHAIERPARDLPRFGLAGVDTAARHVGTILDAATATTVAGRIDQLDVRDRLRIAELIAAEVPVQQATTSNAHISFDYCVVTISRPWMMSAFLTDANWSIPGVAAGAFTRSGAADGMWALPAAVVVIRNLVITANWDAADVAHSANAMSFGPFKITSGVVNGAIRNPGLQTIGWLLDVLPPLPPR